MSLINFAFSRKLLMITARYIVTVVVAIITTAETVEVVVEIAAAAVVVPAKLMPKLLSLEQQELCLEVVQDMLQWANKDPEFLSIVITGDKSWVYGYENRNQGPVVTMEVSNIPKAQKSTTGSEQCEDDTVCFDYRDVVHHEYAPLGQTVSKEYNQLV
jgi:hypothetical protein